MLSPLFEEKKICIQCGNKVKPQHIMLLDQSYLDQECLQYIRQSITNGAADEDMLLYYQYILSLLVNCTKCNSVIDGITRKKTNFQPNNPVCNVCQPLIPPNFKPPQMCDLCDQEIDNKNHREPSVIIEGMKFCHSCYNLQCKGLEEKKQKQKKPDFGEYANNFKNLIKEQEKMPLKLKPHYFQRQPEPKFQKELRLPRRQVEKSTSLAQLFRLPNQMLSQPKIGEMKFSTKELFECSECLKKLQLHFFKLREEDYNVCKNCYEKYHHGLENKPKKKEKRTHTATFGLDLLFEETPAKEQSLKVQQKIEIPEKKEPEKKEEPKTTIETTKDNHLYDIKGCKICFNAQAAMINTKCRHLMICEQCFKQLQSRHKGKGDTLPCPYCATIGRYQIYIEPIYI